MLSRKRKERWRVKFPVPVPVWNVSNRNCCQWDWRGGLFAELCWFRLRETRVEKLFIYFSWQAMNRLRYCSASTRDPIESGNNTTFRVCWRMCSRFFLGGEVLQQFRSAGTLVCGTRNGEGVKHDRPAEHCYWKLLYRKWPRDRVCNTAQRICSLLHSFLKITCILWLFFWFAKAPNR